MLRAARAHPKQQIRLNRRDLTLVYRNNHEIFYRMLKVSVGELHAITDLSKEVWKSGDIPAHIQCGLAISYLTSNSHQYWLGEAVGVSQATTSRCFHRLIRFSPSENFVYILLTASSLIPDKFRSTLGTPLPIRRGKLSLEASRRRVTFQVHFSYFLQGFLSLGCMGALDGTLITVTGVTGTEAEKHQFRPRLRKSFALNVLVLCDHRGKILAFDATAKGRFVTRAYENWNFFQFPRCSCSERIGGLEIRRER